MNDKAVRLLVIGIGFAIDLNSTVSGALLEIALNVLLLGELANPQQEINLAVLCEGMDAIAPGLGTLLSVLVALYK